MEHVASRRRGNLPQRGDSGTVGQDTKKDRTLIYFVSSCLRVFVVKNLHSAFFIQRFLKADGRIGVDILMKNVLWVVPIVAVALLISSHGFAQNGFKLGVVDTQSVFENYKKAKEANDILKNAEDRLMSQLKGLQGDIETMEERLTKQRLFLDAPATESLEADIRLKRQELQHELKKGQEAIVEKQKELVEPILQEIEELLKEIGESEGYGLILEKRLVTLYVDPKYDLTERITQLLDEKYQKAQLNAQKQSSSGNDPAKKTEPKAN